MENKIIDISDALFKKIYSIKDKNIPEVINLDNKFYLAEVISINKIKKSISDPDVKKVILSQIVFQNKIKNNASIAKDISMGGFVGAKFENFASKNGLEVKNYKISNLKQNEVFNESIIKRIFLMKDGTVDLITDSALKENFLVFSIKTNFKNIKKNTNEFEKYEAKARLNLVNNIYQTYDSNLNQKDKVELNQRTRDRVQNSF